MHALITGSSGFVGHHLIRHLEAMGDAVTPTDRAMGGPDISDRESVGQFVRDVQPDVVYHLAGQSDVAHSWADPIGTYRANVEGTLNILDACRDAGVRRVIAVISADVYGRVTPDELPLNERSPFRPVSPYAASKCAADLMCQQAHIGYGADIVRVRPFTHIGPGQSTRFVTSALASRIATAERDGIDAIPVGSLDTRRDFTDVRDVVRAYRLLATYGEAGEVYNVCSGVDVAIRDVAELLLARAERPIRLEFDPALARPADVPVLRGDPTRVHQLTGWKPEFTLESTLRDVLDDWRSRLRRS